MLLPTVTSYIASYLAAFLYDRSSSVAPPQRNAAPLAPLQFDLRHLHAVSSDARVLFHDVPPAALSALSNAGEPTSYPLRPRRIKAQRPRSTAAFHRARRRSMGFQESEAIDWDEIEIEGPDVESQETLLLLAKMTNNAYLEPGEQGWYELGDRWNVLSVRLGARRRWVPRARLATPDNSTIVLSIKGTSAAFIGGGGPTSKKDKFNDNLLFSCCCARVDWTWTTVCDCYRGGWKCDQTCLENALADDSLFYSIGTNLYNNLTYLYPHSDIWMVGHSLGGALASLLGVTFEIQHITHVYHTADPIAMGTCNGVLSSCALGGYAMESKCHLGKSIVYDTVSELSWAVDIRTHTIVNVIEKLLANPWPPSVEIGREVPEAKPEEDCVVSQKIVTQA
ncbi:hypothetical protein BN946_scf184866.g33 [Trametes cinnabarina]|uniref:triacylglycerol lipase n=1 Tax=Pycnoporus cinnabarinus TaxID=5643 RepID=A0A060SKY6_PYCCI|nr:hypothetical protein BN946_scf184866.g33 [Trametes cinnabarina]